VVVVLFRNRLADGVTDEYGPRAAEILELARNAPGFVSYKGFTAADGERLALVEFETHEHVRAWGRNAEHRVAQQQGRDRFYSEYTLTICDPIRESRFDAAQSRK